MTIKGKYVYIFEGVGSEFNQKKCLLTQKQRGLLKKYTEITEDITGVDIWNYMYSMPEDKVNDELKNWLSIYVYDYTIYKIYKKNGFISKAVIAYSMGLISALACIESISFEAGVSLIVASYFYGNDIKKEDPSMAVIIGLSIETLEQIIETLNCKEQVSLASENNEYCMLISGVEKRVKDVVEKAIESGAIKVNILKVPKAFHSEFAKIGIHEYIKVLNEVDISDSSVPILSCYTRKLIHSSSEIKEELIKNLYSRMYWRSAIEEAVRLGNKSFLEVSLSGQLSKMCKSIDKTSEFITFKNVVNYLKEVH